MLPTFSALSSAWLFLLTIPLVIFYFLKLKRPRQVIPSLALWRQVLADQRVNSPFQRFKRNLLLLLQLLLLALLVLAAMQPVLRRGGNAATHLPVLIDVSASMGALDQAGGKTRLAVAKERVRELIDRLPSDQEIALVAFARTARRLTGFTNSKAELRQALASLEVEDVPSELDDALRLVQGLARTVAFDRVWLISDGNFPPRSQFELSYRIDYQRVAPAGSNFGITACNARRDLESQWEVFVQLAGSAEAESTTGMVELLQGEQVVGSERVTLARGSAPRLSFRVGNTGATDLEVRFTPEGFDSLGSDNRAWLRLPAVRPLSAYAPEKLASVRHALAAVRGVEVFPGADGAKQSGYDLVISDEVADLALPARVHCTLGLVPKELESLVQLDKAATNVVDWRRDSPLLQHVSFDDVALMEDPRQIGEGAETRIRELGYNYLADGPHGPVLVEKNEGEQLFVHALFHPDRSTLVYRVGFPVFVSNLVQAALRRTRLSEVAAAQTGVLPATTVESGATVKVTGPDRRVSQESAGADGRLAGVSAPRVGLYTFEGGGDAFIVGAALLSATETALGSVDQIEFAEQLKVTAAGTAPRVDHSLWWPVSVAALVLLAVEWWWFNRRAARA